IQIHLEIKPSNDLKVANSFPSGSLPRNTQPNLKGHNSKAYQPPQSHNEHVNYVFTSSGKSYNLPVNPNDQQNDYENPINFDSDEKDKGPTPQPKNQNPKPVKETPLPKPYKPKILYPQRLRKEKMEAKYGKFLDMICAVRTNVPLIDVLAGMPNYGKFLKELISNTHKIEQISAAFLSDESLAMIQNKVPPKLRDPISFLIPCNFNKTFSCNALADPGASIKLMAYSLYANLSLETLKPTKMSMRLADRSFQYPVGIAENMLVEVGEFNFPVNSTNAFVKETFMDLKTQLETVAKNHQASIQNLETKFNRLADKQSGRPSGSLPRNTQPNLKGHNSKAYQPPQSHNEHVNYVFTSSGKSYNLPVNPNDQQNDYENPINFDSDEKDKGPTPQPKNQNPKPVKETPLPKPYKPKILYPQRLRKEKMEAKYGKFLDMICAVRTNVPLIDVLAGMPNYGKFLKELISNTHKIEQISA
nr:reverse transcriptase domain-containing protein [Tanacetum cinerariifolium]